MSTIAIVTVALAGAASWAGGADEAPVIDPDVRAAAARGGTLRVLVELRVPPVEPSALQNTQDQVLRGLAGTGARLARRYATAPLLALEIDGAALARLEAMPALVMRVRADKISPPYEGSAPRR